MEDMMLDIKDDLWFIEVEPINGDPCLIEINLSILEAVVPPFEC